MAAFFFVFIIILLSYLCANEEILHVNFNLHNGIQLVRRQQSGGIQALS